jgi:tricarballylate dehydrogenase
MKEAEFDVVVVGTGVAGLSAAVAATEAGARVGVIERAAEGSHGGNTRYTEAFLRMKSLEEVSDDFEDCFAAESGYNIDERLLLDSISSDRAPIMPPGLNPEVIAVFAENAGPTLAWMQTAGVRFGPTETPFITASTTRLAPVGGGLAIVEAMTARAKELGVTFLFETTASDLITEDGRVVGVVARDADGELRVGGTVILACGGFEGNPEMVARYSASGRFARPVARGGYYNKGEGIEMALAIGAAPAGDFNIFHAEPIDPRSGEPEPAIFSFGYGILVDRGGRRFIDEATGTSDATYEAITRVILERPGGVAYTIFDQKTRDVPGFQRGIRTEREPITADTIAALAEAIGVPGDVLEAEVAAYNAACRDGDFTPLSLDGLATEGLAIPKSNWARSIDEGPFFAYPIMSANVFTFGGLRVDPDAAVLDGDGRRIPGLYAAGETMGIYYGRYTGSTSVLRGAVFGRISGHHAASVAAS